jgi:hypothetical protein
MHGVSRDPFARTTLVRTIVRPLAPGQDCGWCGNVRHARRGGPSLFRYGTEPDAVRPRVHWHDGAFCSKPCHDAYHT